MIKNYFYKKEHLVEEITLIHVIPNLFDVYLSKKGARLFYLLLYHSAIMLCLKDKSILVTCLGTGGYCFITFQNRIRDISLSHLFVGPEII